MFKLLPARWLAIAFAAGSAWAQQPAPASQPYRSAFDGYRPFTEEKLAPWRESNDNVGRIGGWRAYAREAQGAPAQPASPAASQPASAAPRAGSAHQH